MVDSYKLLARNDVTTENLKVARIVGWCIEMVSLYALLCSCMPCGKMGNLLFFLFCFFFAFGTGVLISF